MKAPIIETERVILRPLSVNDASDIYSVGQLPIWLIITMRGKR